jgi:hypothetical protein
MPCCFGLVQVEAAGVVIPSTDDGTTVILRGLPKAWGVPRVRAYTERYSQRPLQVAKPDNSDWAVVVFASADSRAAFVEKRQEHLAAAQSADNFQLEFPGESKPPQAQQQQQQLRGAAGGAGGTKRSAGEAGAGPSGAGVEAAGPGGRARKQRRTDVREAVCPLWDVPYKDQLARKLVAIQDTLKDTAKQVRGIWVDQQAGRTWEPHVCLFSWFVWCVGGHCVSCLVASEREKGGGAEQQLLGDEPYQYSHLTISELNVTTVLPDSSCCCSLCVP